MLKWQCTVSVQGMGTLAHEQLEMLDTGSGYDTVRPPDPAPVLQLILAFAIVIPF